MTEDWFPYQYEQEGEVVGIAADTVVLLLERVGSDQDRRDIRLYPWARAYKMLLSEKHTILFSVTRTPEREDLFKWAGPLFHNTTYLIARKDRGASIASPEDISKYRIGTIIDDASELFVQRLGIGLDRVQRNSKSIYNVEKLERGRIDLVVSGWFAFESDARQLEIDPGDYEAVFTVDESDVSIAFHAATPDWVIGEFQAALDDLRDEGALNEIAERYRYARN
jgi:polar amino acid transport system substrate-binding protein